ncbi:hypothetical protein ACFQL7_24565 [Halocatena marina]|uniref:Uncharacterized protein n=1 Tax=Halocatena marina TaxID=2934937 RepID=A0ABD5YTR5_9EURY
MAVSALIWISLTTLVSGLCMVAFVLHYVRANECDFMAFAVAVVFGGVVLNSGWQMATSPKVNCSLLLVAFVLLSPL